MLTPEPGVVVGGRYLIVRPLAKGGMGSVWIARHRDLDIDVTVKFMEPSLLANNDLRLRFKREAKVAARLRSRHIVQVLDYGMDEDMPYLAMELLHGESLADRITRAGRLSVGATAHILQQICKALRIAHDEELVHRDLKPGNIFLALEDNEEVVKVLDFGIVKERNDANEAKLETGTGIAMGSVHYMSPEQIRSSRSVDARSDLWSVAVILYKMLTGDVPFQGTNHGDVMVRVCTDPVAPPSFVVPSLPKEMDAFFARALARDPAARYQTAEELAEAFAGVACLVPSDEPVQDGPSRGWKKTMKLPRLPLASPPPTPVARGVMVQTLPFPVSQRAKEPSFVSAVLETAPGTFQAVTMRQGAASNSSSHAAMPTERPPRVPHALVGAAMLAVAAGAGLVGVVASKWGTGSREAISAGASVSAVRVPTQSTSTETNTAMLPSASPLPMISASTVPSASVKPPATSMPNPSKTAPTGTVPGTATVAPRSLTRNPLDEPN